jgi:hypothetical protein
MAKFLPGQSGNPNGKPKKKVQMERAAQKTWRENIKTLVTIRDDAMAPKGARLDATRELLDRGFGKPVAPTEGTVSGTIVLQVVSGIGRNPSDIDDNGKPSFPGRGKPIEMTATIIDQPPEPAQADSATTPQAIAGPADDMPHSARDVYR